MAAADNQTVHWDDSTVDGETKYAFETNDVTFPWTFTLATGCEVNSINWLYSGDSDTNAVMAVFLHNAFVATPAFSGRVTRATNGGIVLKHVTTGDCGSYRVEVMGRTGEGVAFSAHRSAQLRVGVKTENFVDNIAKRLAQLEAEATKHTARLAELETEKSNLAQRLAEQEANQTQLKELNSDLTRRVQHLEARARQQIMFHARILKEGTKSITITEGKPLVMKEVLLNKGDAYDTETGIFHAPVSGLYFFSACSGCYTTDGYARFEVCVDEEEVSAEGITKGPGSGQSASVQVCVEVMEGQTVWVRSGASSVSFLSSASSFSGCLLAANEDDNMSDMDD